MSGPSSRLQPGFGGGAAGCSAASMRLQKNRIRTPEH